MVRDEGEYVTIVVSACQSVPPFAQGLVRDLRVRWAIEEGGLPYEQKPLAAGEKETADYRGWQPAAFGA
jgi:glutathione S-transferase